ncbi:MAG: helix-turn-helix transcriptional regulator, partial [Muribaculaceae bacterium]|nr:helix-turn-helix transcriptional regulator [Muribaculaceae bacterium]
QRELQVLKFLAEGISSREIAKEMFISLNTVQYHRKQLLRTTDSHNVAELISKSFKQNLNPSNN